MCSRWSRFYLQDIGKVKEHSMFPFKTRNVMKKMLTNIVTHGVPFGRKRTRNLNSSWWRIQIYVSFLAKCSLFGTRIIGYKLGGPTLIWTIRMSQSGTWRLIHLFWIPHTTWSSFSQPWPISTSNIPLSIFILVSTHVNFSYWWVII
jgi:hypothetical protein